MAEQAREAIDLTAVFQPHARERMTKGMCRDADTLDIGLVADAIEHLVYPAGGQWLAPPAQEDMALAWVGGFAVEPGVLPEELGRSWADTNLTFFALLA